MTRAATKKRALMSGITHHAVPSQQSCMPSLYDMHAARIHDKDEMMSHPHTHAHVYKWFTSNIATLLCAPDGTCVGNGGNMYRAHIWLKASSLCTYGSKRRPYTDAFLSSACHATVVSSNEVSRHAVTASDINTIATPAKKDSTNRQNFQQSLFTCNIGHHIR